MPIIIEKIDMPSECHSCIFEDRVGGCIILNKTGVCGKSYEEYDDEWHRAHKEHRRLKWCPLKEKCELSAERRTEKDHFADVGKKQPRKAINERVYCKDCKYLMLSDCYGECSKAYRGIVNPDDYCEHGKRGKK